MWDTSQGVAVKSFDLGCPVGDVSWAPYSSTTFAAVTDDGKAVVYDLAVNHHGPMCEQKVVKKAKATKLAFNRRSPLLLVGDSAGGVTSFKLSPNLRKLTPIPVPPFRKVRARACGCGGGAGRPLVRVSPTHRHACKGTHARCHSTQACALHLPRALPTPTLISLPGPSPSRRPANVYRARRPRRRPRARRWRCANWTPGWR